MRKQFDSTSCPTCDTLFERLPVEYDEDGGYVFLEVHPCAGCGQTFCIDHLVSVPDGTETPLHCCGPCAAECEPFQLPTRIPPQSEGLAPSHLGVA